MAHPAQEAFVQSVKKRLPEHFENVTVLDAGSADINGTNLHHFTNAEYTGLDIAPAKNVDVVSPIHLYNPDKVFDVVISTECLEHDMYYEKSLGRMAELTRKGGLMVLTCATLGRDEHGTRRTTGGDSLTSSSQVIHPQRGPWQDYYCNVTQEMIREAIPIEDIFSEFGFENSYADCDLYFWGLKK